jgi:hypothetical protein
LLRLDLQRSLVRFNNSAHERNLMRCARSWQANRLQSGTGTLPVVSRVGSPSYNKRASQFCANAVRLLACIAKNLPHVSSRASCLILGSLEATKSDNYPADLQVILVRVRVLVRRRWRS